MPDPKLLKVVVQPTYVVEVHGHLREVPTQPVQVNAEDWAAFAADGLDKLAEQVALDLVAAESAAVAPVAPPAPVRAKK